MNEHIRGLYSLVLNSGCMIRLEKDRIGHVLSSAKDIYITVNKNGIILEYIDIRNNIFFYSPRKTACIVTPSCVVRGNISNNVCNSV